MSDYERQSEQATEAGCGCLGFLLQCAVTVWVLSSHLGIFKSILVALVMTLTTWVLALVGIAPVLGQMLYKNFAMDVILWILGILKVDPNINLIVPGFVNFILRWLLGEDEITGSLSSYVYGVGYTWSIFVSFTVVVGFIIWIVATIWLRHEED